MSMLERWPLWSMIAFILLIVVCPAAQAQDKPRFEYDIYVHDSCLMVWLNLAPFIDSKTLSRLKDGVDLEIECRVRLEIPRRFWSDKIVATRSRFLRLGYRQVTNDFLLKTDGPVRPGPLAFPSLPALIKYLSDSVELCMGNVRQLNDERHHRLGLSITTISLTDFNLARDITGQSNSDSPLKYLFGQFLKLTEYGRHEFSARSRTFSIGELEEIE